MRKEIVTNERERNINNLSMRMQRRGPLHENESAWMKSKGNKTAYPVNFLFRDLNAFRMADLQKPGSSQVSGNEIVLTYNDCRETETFHHSMKY